MTGKGFKITEHSDVYKELLHYRENYNERGKYLGFEALDNFYTMQLGNVTDWTGFPMSGKTQVLMELLLNTSKFYGWKHLLYFPDVGNRTEIVADLMHKLTGKTFNPKYDNHIDEVTIQKELNWLLYHFKILTKVDIKAKLTPFEFWDMAVEIKKKEGLHTACIDSWKDMSHEYSKYGNYATYLEVVLPYRNQIAEDNDLHLHTVIHPKLTEKENGIRKAPSPYDLKGGSEWFNSGKCMITVHRESKEDNEVQIIFGKIKPRSIGSIGEARLKFDLKRFVYFDDVDGQRVYAAAKGKEKPEYEPKQEIKANLDFLDSINQDLPF
jgi:hypothetical protein